jgi:prevent-host-death family protein
LPLAVGGLGKAVAVTACLPPGLKSVPFWSTIVTMLMVNIADLKAKLSEYLEAVSRGEHVVVCNRNQPVAELRAIEPKRTAPRDLSAMFPDWKIDPAFFEPMTDEDLEQWYGRDPLPARVAEKAAPPYREAASKARRKKKRS